MARLSQVARQAIGNCSKAAQAVGRSRLQVQQRQPRVMNFHQSYALSSRIGTGRLLRHWTALTRTSVLAAFLLTDVMTIIGVSWVTGVSYHLYAYRYAGHATSYLQVGVICAIVYVMPNLFRGEYHLPNFFAFRPHLRRTIQLWTVTLVCMLALGFLTRITAVYSRGWIVVFYLSTLSALLVLRYLYVQTTVAGSKTGLISAQRVYLIGSARHIEEFVTRYQPRIFGVNIVGCQFLSPVDPDAPPAARQRALQQDLDQAVAGARQLQPDAIVLAMPWSAAATIERCAETLLKLPAEIHLGPESILDRFVEVQISKVGPIASLQLRRMPLSRLELLEKRVFDVVIASAALLLLTPLLIVCAMLIKLDSPGPVFFVQRRFGFNQEPFRIFKLRSMRTLDDGPVVRQACLNDPRVTRIGAFLRRWNIDEIPQLFNVILGDMSLVGPRPHALSHDREYERRISTYARRHNVKPGITGWAQIHGLRGQTDTDEKMRIRVEHDLYYIDNWSLALDLVIMIRTVISRASYRNAY
jgi:Undecaprenyl-phosphate glucose phosphotransferase